MKRKLSCCKTFVLFFIFLLLNCSLSFSADYYWVGGSGQVNDYANHWATTSGGSVFYSVVPATTDNLIFDVNSFTAPGQIVSESVLPQVLANNFICTGTLYSPTFDFSNLTVLLDGNLVLDTGITWVVGIGNIVLEGGPSSIITLNTHNIQLPSIQANYSAGSGILSLASNLSCGDFDMAGCNFYSNNYTITMANFYNISAVTPPVIYFGTSSVFCSGNFDATNAGSGLHADSCTLILNQDLTTPFYCSNQNFNRVVLSDNTAPEGQIIGSHFSINSLEFVGASMAGDLHIDSCHITKLIAGNSSGDFDCVHVDVDTLIFNNYSGGHITFPTEDTVTVNDLLVINPNTWLSANTFSVIKKIAGDVCADNIHLQNIHAAGGAQFFAGINSLDDGVNTGWQFIDCTPAVSNVWPGDANYDLTANNLDLINIGLNFGSTGAVRPSASNNWTAQPCPDWTGYFNNGANFKHADCNGDGIVDANDTLAISLNYGQTHPFRQSHQDNSVTSGGADLYFDLTGVSVIPGNMVTIPVKLGTAIDAVSALYGTAFTINYNPAFVDAQGVSVSFTNSWLSSGLMLTFVRDFPGTGQTDISIVRTDHTDMAGSGTMAEITFTVPLTATGNFFLSFSNVDAVISSSNELTVSPEDIGTATQVFYPVGGSPVNFYPNPVTGSLHIAAQPFRFNKIIIKDIAGQTVKTSSFETEIDFSSLQKGAYFIELLSHNELVARTRIIHL